MGLTWIQSPKGNTKFAPSLKYPTYVAKDGTKDFVDRFTSYVIALEKDIISKEELVSKVPKSTSDSYAFTQQWKQHNLLKDDVGLGGEHLDRFPHNPVIDEFYQIIRTNYLLWLAELKYPRIKAYAHAWANILRPGQSISKHSHVGGIESYIAATYYLTNNNTHLYLEGIDPETSASIKTEQRKLVMFPSWIIHHSDVCKDESLRISIAVDIVTETTVKNNPWRPHVLLDNPSTMPGLEN